MEQGSLSTDISRSGLAQIAAGSAMDHEHRVLWSIEQLAERERTIDVETIWIVGRDFGTDLPDKPFYDVMRRNIVERNIKYAYVALDTQGVRRQLHNLTSALQLPNPSHLQVFLLGAERWSELPYTAGDPTIYDRECHRNCVGTSERGSLCLLLRRITWSRMSWCSPLSGSVGSP